MADLEAVQDVYRRLTRAPLIRKVKQAQAQVAAALEAVHAAEVAVDAAARVLGESVGEAFRHREVVLAQHAEHRKGALARDLFAATFDDIGYAHLVRSFVLDRHIALQQDETPVWEDWTPPDHPVGLVAEGEKGLLLRWGGYAGDVDSPMFDAAPLIGGGKPWVIFSDDESEARARELLRALVLRLACTLPQQSRFMLLDPLHYGQTFPMQRYLPAVRGNSDDPLRDLQSIQADMRRIIKDVANGSFEGLPAEQKAAERYEFVIAADFPRANAYDRRFAEMLFDIGRAGPKAGRYLILHVTDGAEWPHGINLSQLGDYTSIDLRGGRCAHADVPPSDALQLQILERVRGATSVRRSAGFTEILPPHKEWWTNQAVRRIETTLDGRKNGLEIVFGQREDGTELVHGILAAAAGAGKSNLLHTLLLGFATRYPPEELQLYLMDLKQGVEFQPYARLPHAAVVAYNADASLARAVISELRLEMRRRYEELFRRSGVQKLEEYRNIGQPHGPAPRILLVVDEYHALFQGADAQEVSADLLALSTQGRAAGVHMLLGSQTFRAVGMQSSEQILNNINIRMAMRMPAAVVQAMTEFEREGKDLILSCDAPGKLVLNNAAGSNGSGNNRLGQVVLVSADDRSRVLDELVKTAGGWPAENRALWPTTQVFDGSQAPPLDAHVLTRAVRRHGQALDASRLGQWAATAKSGGGLARGDWRMSDGPVPLLIGREYAVHGDAAVVLRRLPNQNLLLLGGSMPARLGMLGGVAASAIAVEADVLAQVRVIDFSNDPSTAAMFAAAGDRIGMVDSTQMLSALEAPSNGSTDLLVLIEPDRCVDLLRPSDPLARAAGVDALERRLREGPLGGRHTVLVCSGYSALTRVLGRRGAASFVWRAVTQISQEDSQELLGNRLGAQLRGDGGGPEAALLADVDGNRNTRFMPYGV